jgi:branched-chain amino acid transport system permease protein
MNARYAAFALLAAAALLAPFVISDFWVFVLIESLVFALYAVTFNLLLGYGGMIAFGHAAFFGIGAYTLAVLLKKSELPVLLAAALSPAMAALCGAIVAYFCLRLRGIYLGMLTFSFQMLAYTVVFKWYELTGGDDGLSGLTFAGPLGTPRGFYYLSFVIVAAALYLLWRLVNSPFGWALKAQRSNDSKSLAIGINTALVRWLAFVIAAFFAGLAGALFALASQSVFPGWLNWTSSAVPIVMTILGGMQSFIGPIIGALIYVMLQTVLTGLTEYWALVMGVVIIAIVMLLPGGVMSLFHKAATHD